MITSDQLRSIHKDPPIKLTLTRLDQHGPIGKHCDVYFRFVRPHYNELLASRTPGIDALCERRNPAAGPVIAATSMYAAGCAICSSIFQRKAVWSFKPTVGTLAQ